MADEVKELITLLGKDYSHLTKLIQANEAERVKVPQDVLDQGKEAQFPDQNAPPEPTPPTQNVSKGTSGSNPSSRKQNRQAPSASE